VYNPDLVPDGNIYYLVLKTCALTSNPDEFDRALQIALEVYRRINDRNMTVSSSMYIRLLSCVADFLPENSERRLELSQALFECANLNGRVNANVVKQLSRANPDLYRIYVSRDNAESLNEE
jgi:hypothetical protein